jgi:putative membrane protein
MNALGGSELVIAVALAYAIGLHRMWSRVGRGRLVPAWRACVFALGMLALGVALGPPLDREVGQSLTLHMTQHIVLIWLAAPLIVLGAPLPTLLWATPDRGRVRLQRVWQRAHFAVSGDRWPFWVAFAAFLQSATLLVWHLPALYQRAVDSGFVHSLEHASFFFTAVFFWWTIAGAVRRSRFGAGVLVVFVTKFPALFLGVGMTLATRTWYPVYGSDAAALHDQQGAGVVMWVFGGMLATIAGLALFCSWMRALERATPSDPFPVRREGLRT